MKEEIRELVGTIIELLANLEARIDDIYNRAQTGESVEEGRIVYLIDDLGALMEGISAIARFYDRIEIPELQEKLSVLYETLEKQDVLLSADVLEYELKPLLTYWSGILSKE